MSSSASASSALPTRMRKRANPPHAYDRSSLSTSSSYQMRGELKEHWLSSSSPAKRMSLGASMTLLLFLFGGLLLFNGKHGGNSDSILLKNSNIAVRSLSITNFKNDDTYDGPPHDLVVRGRRERYSPIPETHLRKFWVEGKGEDILTRAFRNRGWQKVDKLEEAQFFYKSRGARGQYYYEVGKPWQRYSRVPGISIMESKDGFLEGFRKYQRAHPEDASIDLYFLPETYRMLEAADREAFRRVLYEQGGMGRPWVKKNVDVNNGQGIEMLGPNSEELVTAVDRAVADSANTYIIQGYVCNELTWFHGEKFDLRMYWMIASIDPPIVLYHDGYVRVGAANYNETDFSSTGQHLTNHQFRTEDQSAVTSEHLWKRIREHYQANRERLSTLFNIQDPVKHVRNQMKESLGTLVAAFRDVSFGGGDSTKNVTVENLFGFYGADFIIDADLDVYFVETQASPGFGEEYDYRVDMFRSLFRPLVDIVEEIQLKQIADPTANLLPLTTLQEWEIVYAGDWQYKYPSYQRSKEHKKGCSLESSTA